MRLRLDTRRLAQLATLAGTLLLGGCVVGPDFTTPGAALPDVWQPSTSNSRFSDQAISQHWWNSFNDPLIEHLIARVGRDNLDLQMAVERVRQSESLLGGVAADALPSVDGALGYSRARNSQKGLLDSSGNEGKEAFSLWSSALASTWELDLWGRVRRAVEAADAGVAVAEADRQAVYTALMADTAAHYIRLRGVQELLAVTRQSLTTAQKTTELTRVRLEQGVATDLEVAQAAALSASIRARIPTLEQRQQETLSALSLLLAAPPGSLEALLSAPAPVPSTQRSIALGLPSELAERRPDIRKAEAELHAATASIGVAKANFYPSISLTGRAGFQANQLSELGSWGSRQFAFGPSLNLPIFEGGRLKAMLSLSEARQREAALRYQKVVLTAWHEVRDAMAALEHECTRHDDLRESVTQSQKALQSVQLQYQQGTTDFLNVLSVQNMLLANQSALATSTAAVSLSAVRLYKALGGGWDTDDVGQTAPAVAMH